MTGDEWQKWSALADIWQSPGEPLDITDLRRQLRVRSRNGAILFVLDIAQAAVAIGVAVMLLDRWTWPFSLVGITMLLFGGFSLALALWTRFASDGPALASVDDPFRLAAGQARAGIRWAISGYCIVTTGLVLLAVLAYAHGHPAYEAMIPLPFWVKALFVSAYMSFWLWRCTRLLRENRRYLRGLQAIEPALFAAENRDNGAMDG